MVEHGTSNLSSHSFISNVKIYRHFQIKNNNNALSTPRAERTNDQLPPFISYLTLKVDRTALYLWKT